MQILIVGDAFPPMRTSGALMLGDLASELVSELHAVTVIVPSSVQKVVIVECEQGFLRVLWVRAFETKDVGYVRRLCAEFINPFIIWIALKRYKPFISSSYDLIIWYSPSIFWGPLIKRIRKRWQCKSYLVLRDIFPDWAIDLGLIKKTNLVSFFLHYVAHYQYQQANLIGVQSPNNAGYLSLKYPKLTAKIRVLWNWIALDTASDRLCSIRISETSLAQKKIFIYAGNIGVAQGVETFLKIIESVKDYEDVGFIFVGRGSEMNELRSLAEKLFLKNILFFPEISSNQINELYSQCHAGLIVLDEKHKTHNIPGKFVSYMRAGLPVFGVVNPGNDLLNMVKEFDVGLLGHTSNPHDLDVAAKIFIKNYLASHDVRERCQNLCKMYFDSRVAAKNILQALY